MRHATPCALTLLLALASAGEPVAAQDVVPGKVTRRITTASDATQQYALYVPSSYTPDRPWPVLYAMDPRGRALVPLELFREAAERLGWVVASSYNSASDTSAEPNFPAMAAMLDDTQIRLNVDERRLYLAGFSGTARVSWDLARSLRGHVSGIIGVGGALPLGLPHSAVPVLWDMSFAFFGCAGNVDFNFEEMELLDHRLDEYGMSHRLVHFEGEHQWMSPAVATESVEWMELQAMRRGLTPIDTVFVNERYAADLAIADALIAAGDLYEGHRRLHMAVNDYGGLRDTTIAAGRRDALGRDRSVRDGVKRRAREAKEFFAFQKRYVEDIGALWEAKRPLRADRLIDRLKIDELLKRERAGDSADSLQARRMLEALFVFTSFYQPQLALERGDPELARVLLAVAEAIRPGTPRVCLEVARAETQLGNKAEAMEAIRCVIRSGLRDVDFLERDIYLKPLLESPGVDSLLRVLVLDSIGS